MIFELIQIALGVRERLSHPLTPEEWDGLFAEAQKQSVAGIAFEGVQRLPSDQWPPQVLLYEWIGAAESIRKRNVLLDRQCMKLQKRLGEAGIRSSILKGQGVARCYRLTEQESRKENLAALRQPGDIDVYVDCGRERALLFARHCGMKDVAWDYKHLHLDVFHDTEVEVHYRVEVLLNLWKNRKLQKWFKEHEELLFSQNGELTTPTIGFNRFYILLHIYRHFLYEGVGLRQLLDYYFVLKANTNLADDPNVSDLLKRFGMWKFGRGVMWILQVAFGLEREYMIGEPLESEGRFILQEVMAGGNFGHHDERLLSGKGGKLQTLKKVVKHNAHLLWHYPVEILWPPVWFAWHKCWKLAHR